MPCKICWTKITQSDKELATTIEKLFDDPVKQRALYFNLKFKQVKSDLVIVLAQRDRLIKDNMQLQADLTKQKKVRLVLTIGGFVLGISVGFGLAFLGAKMGQLVAAWR